MPNTRGLAYTAKASRQLRLLGCIVVILLISIADMATEIERKFLPTNDNWRGNIHDKKKIRQGYLANTAYSSVRIRVAESEASLNIKGMTIGVTRTEYEYPVPVKDAQELLKNLCIGALVVKTRYYLEHDKHLWEIDVFEGENSGLVVAEIELTHPTEEFLRPEWLGEEVTEDERYYNFALVNKPYKDW